MYEIGWKIDSNSNNPYIVPGNYSLGPFESQILGDLISRHREISKSRPLGNPNGRQGESFASCKPKIGFGDALPSGKPGKFYNSPSEGNPGSPNDTVAGSKALSDALKAQLIAICRERNFPMRMERAKLILEIARLNIGGLGALTCLLLDDSLEEIAVAGINTPIRAYRRGKGWLDTNCFFTSMEFAISVVNRMARPLGRRITYASPTINAMLADGARLHASIFPANREGIEITIRKFPKTPLAMEHLISNSTITARAAALLALACAGDTTILICGNTGSGKTTLLNALLCLVPHGQRIISIEETPEIRIANPHRVSMVAGGSDLTMERLTHDTLRMRPDRIAIGEVRSRGEAFALFESLLAGQAKGAFATFHANSAREAASRLRMLGIPSSDLSCLDIIVVIRRISEINGNGGEMEIKGNAPGNLENGTHIGGISEIRRVMEISEMDEAGNVSELFHFDAKKGGLICDQKSLLGSRLLGKLALNYKMGPKDLLLEMEKREKGFAANALG